MTLRATTCSFSIVRAVRSLEVETQLEIARNLGFLPDERFAAIYDQAAEASRVLNGLIAKTVPNN
jgi:four helix bundle protein